VVEYFFFWGGVVQIKFTFWSAEVLTDCHAHSVEVLQTGHNSPVYSWLHQSVDIVQRQLMAASLNKSQIDECKALTGWSRLDETRTADWQQSGHQSRVRPHNAGYVKSAVQARPRAACPPMAVILCAAAWSAWQGTFQGWTERCTAR